MKFGKLLGDLGEVARGYEVGESGIVDTFLADAISGQKKLVPRFLAFFLQSWHEVLWEVRSHLKSKLQVRVSLAFLLGEAPRASELR